jgi:hypothetical protein
MLTVVDEQFSDVVVYDTTLAQAHAVHEFLAKREECADGFDALAGLLSFMTKKTGNKQLLLEKPKDDPEAWGSLSAGLGWFTTPEATRLLEKHKSACLPLKDVFGFARTAVDGYAFIARANRLTQFVGYENVGPIVPGMVLMDATADVDRISDLCPWRKRVATPEANYANLSIIHVTPPARTTNLKKHLAEKRANSRSYVAWMVEVIKQHMQPGQKGLVVCLLDLFQSESVPNWREGDPRFKEPQVYTEAYGWDIEGRQLCATHWGSGIGSNKWQEADAVFLFHDWYLPRRVHAAHVQGHRNHKASEGELGQLTALSSRSEIIETMSEGHKLRQLQQMALRGKARDFEDHGICKPQKLVYGGAYDLLITHKDRLFPGSPQVTKVRTQRAQGRQEKRIGAVIEFMSTRPLTTTTITNKDIAKAIGGSISYRDVQRSPKAMKALKEHGWEHEGGQRGKPAKYVRGVPQAATVSSEGILASVMA